MRKLILIVVLSIAILTTYLAPSSYAASGKPVVMNQEIQNTNLDEALKNLGPKEREEVRKRISRLRETLESNSEGNFEKNQILVNNGDGIALNLSHMDKFKNIDEALDASLQKMQPEERKTIKQKMKEKFNYFKNYWQTNPRSVIQGTAIALTVVSSGIVVVGLVALSGGAALPVAAVGLAGVYFFASSYFLAEGVAARQNSEATE